MNIKEIMSEKNKPFTDRMAAQIKAETITEETGILYRVQQRPEGYVIVIGTEEKNHDSQDEFNPDISNMDHLLSIDSSDEPEFLKKHPAPEVPTKNEKTKIEFVDDVIDDIKTEENQKPKNQQVIQDIIFRPAWRGQINYHLMAGMGVIFAFFNRQIMALGLTEKDMINMQDWVMFWDILQSIGYGLFLYALLMSYLSVIYFKYTLTAKSLTANQGIIAREKPTISLEDISKNEVKQTVLERLINIGTIELSTPGTGDIDLYLQGIKDPEQMQKIINKRKKS